MKDVNLLKTTERAAQGGIILNKLFINFLADGEEGIYVRLSELKKSSIHSFRLMNNLLENNNYSYTSVFQA